MIYTDQRLAALSDRGRSWALTELTKESLAESLKDLAGAMLRMKPILLRLAKDRPGILAAAELDSIRATFGNERNDAPKRV